MTDESPQAKKNGHGAGSRERRLRGLPHWEEIEVRLQHRWTPDRVLEWRTRAYPGEPAPARKTLYRFLDDQAESWYVPQLVVDQTDTGRVPGASASSTSRPTSSRRRRFGSTGPWRRRARWRDI